MSADLHLVRVIDAKLIYRVLVAEHWFDAERDPPPATEAAFLRRDVDVTGISVFIEPHFCFMKVRPENVRAIAALRVADIRTLSNPITHEQLDVLQDTPTHAYIQNAPFHLEHAKEANDIALQIAARAVLLNQGDLKSAAQRALEITSKRSRIASLVAWLMKML